MYLVAIYVLFSILVAWFGRDTRIGWFGFFILSLFITPMITALVLLATEQR